MAGQSIYCYDESTVLKNRLNIRDKKTLESTERLISIYKLGRLELHQTPFPLTWDASHYLALHKYIFEDIYSFAGEIRSEAIYKTNKPYAEGATPFCYPSFIYQQLSYTLQNMKNSFLKVKTREELLIFIAHYYAELNIIHPFREGNGRTLREFLREFIEENTKKKNGLEDQIIEYKNWNQADRVELLKATIVSSKSDDILGLAKLYDKVLITKQKELQANHVM